MEVSDLKAAFKRIGSLVQRDAQARAPKKTGRLAASIRPSNTKNKSILRAGSARVVYAGVQHYGGYNNIKPHPYLTDAVEANRAKVKQELDKELRSLINKLHLK